MSSDNTHGSSHDNDVKTVAVYFGGSEYSADDLTIGDIAELEEEFGEPIEEIDFSRKKAVIWLVWLVRRTREPDLTIEDVARTKIRDLMAESGDDGSRPTADPGGDSQSGKNGNRGTRKSSGSSRGNTSD